MKILLGVIAMCGLVAAAAAGEMEARWHEFIDGDSRFMGGPQEFTPENAAYTAFLRTGWDDELLAFLETRLSSKKLKTTRECTTAPAMEGEMALMVMECITGRELLRYDGDNEALKREIAADGGKDAPYRWKLRKVFLNDAYLPSLRAYFLRSEELPAEFYELQNRGAYRPAMAILEKEAAAGNRAAMVELSEYNLVPDYRFPDVPDLKNDSATAVALLEKATGLGSREAWRRLGWHYEQGRGVEKDLAQAQKCFRKGGERGKAEMMELMEGFAVKGAAEFFRQALELAEQGKILGYKRLAFCYGNCVGTGGEAADIEKMWHYLSLAAKAGDPGALNQLAESVEAWDPEAPKDSLFRMYRRAAAELGYLPAAHNLARCYEEGIGVEKDPEQAFVWYREEYRYNGLWLYKLLPELEKRDPERARRLRLKHNK